MPEIGGREAILVDPTNSEAICEMMLRLETDDAFCNEKIAVGLQRAKLFSWKITAEQLHQLYHEVMEDQE
jgi:glycosyltransferase involved in cell wall biosynthesis